MVKKNSCTLIAIGMCFSITPIVLSLSTSQTCDNYQIKCCDSTFIGLNNQDGCAQNKFHLYRNDYLCQDNVTWIVQSENKKIKIDSSTGLLSWNKMNGGSYHFEVIALRDNYQVSRFRSNLQINNHAIIGPVQLRGYYDQKGQSSQDYLLIDENGKIVQNVTWDIQGDEIDKTKIKFENNKLSWSADLTAKIYRFIVVAKKDNQNYRTKVSLTIVKNYSIRGQTSFEIEKIRSGESETNYCLFQDNKLSDHHNFSWTIKDVEKQYKDKITVDPNGKIKWNNIVSHTCFRVVAISNSSEQELASLIIHFHCKQYQYKIQGQNDLSGCYVEQDSSNFIFLVNEKQISNDEVIWKLSDQNESIFINDNGLVTWKDDLAVGAYYFRVWGFLRSDENAITSLLCHLEIKNLYTIKGDKKEFVCPVGESGNTNATFVLTRTDKKNPPRTTFKITKTTVGDQEIDNTIFSYNSRTNFVEWNSDIKEKKYTVTLTAYVGTQEKEVDQIEITIDAVIGQIKGKTRPTFILKKASEMKYTFDISGIDHAHQADWTLSNDLNGVLTIDQGVLRYNGANTKPEEYKITISAIHKVNKVKAKMDITLIIKDDLWIEGDTEITCSIYKTTTHEKAYVVKTGKGQSISNITWKLIDAPNGVTISDGKLKVQKNCLKKQKYSFYLKAYTNKGMYCDAVLINLTTKAIYNDASWKNVQQVANQGLAYFMDHFDFTSTKDFIGVSKILTYNDTSYNVRIVDTNHDDKTTGGKAALTFEFVEVIGTSLLDWVVWNDLDQLKESNYKISVIREKARKVTSSIEKENDFTITTVNKKTQKGFLGKDYSFDATLETTEEKGYLPSLSEFSDAHHEDEATFAFYKGKKEHDSFYVKIDNGFDITHDYWVRTPMDSSDKLDHRYVWCIHDDGHFSKRIMNIPAALVLCFSL